VTSPRRIAANRQNAKNSTGPRTRAGRQRSSTNAIRHRLSATVHLDIERTATIDKLATLICQGNCDPLLREAALAIAENVAILIDIRQQQVTVVERLRRGRNKPLANGDPRIAEARWRFAQAEIAADRLDRLDGIKTSVNRTAKRPKWHDHNPHAGAPRNVSEALRLAMRDLFLLRRYQRQAIGRLKRAIRDFRTMQIGLGNTPECTNHA
jgi:hypothetical protein